MAESAVERREYCAFPALQSWWIIGCYCKHRHMYVAVSAHIGHGIDVLLTLLDAVLSPIPPTPASTACRASPSCGPNRCCVICGYYTNLISTFCILWFVVCLLLRQRAFPPPRTGLRCRTYGKTMRKFTAKRYYLLMHLCASSVRTLERNNTSRRWFAAGNSAMLY